MSIRSGRWALVVALGVMGACTLETKTVSGPQGMKGDKGDPGTPGMPGMADLTELAALKAQIEALQTKVAVLEKQAADPDCPVGYTRADMNLPIVCVKGADEVVKAGSGATAFWVDRYEASVWSDPAGTAIQYGAFVDDYPSTFPKNGQATKLSDLCFAVSKNHVPPSANITWFQASLACRASGKRLPSGTDWIFAATGVGDPGVNPGLDGACVTKADGKRNTGTVSCTSLWGAQDMIGNLWEWTDEWYAGLGAANITLVPWGDQNLYHEDFTWNIQSSSHNGSGIAQGVPSVGFRGGSYADGLQAGIFALDLDYAPSQWALNLGFRCLISR